MKDFLDKKAKMIDEDEKKNQKPEYKNNPAFGDPSHHSNVRVKMKAMTIDTLIIQVKNLRET